MRQTLKFTRRARWRRGLAGRSESGWSGALCTSVFPLLVLLGCGRPLDEQECGLLLDRYTEKLILNEQPHAPVQFIHEKQREARSLAKRESQYEFDACASKVSRRQYQCAMQAPDVDEIERCLTL